MKFLSRTGIVMAAILGVGACAVAFAQMMPPPGGTPPMGGGYTPPPTGGGGVGGGVYMPPGGGSGTGGGGAPAGPTYYSVTVAKAGSGSGTVTATSAMINCGVSCSAQVMGGGTVYFSVAPDAGSVFGGWSGDCSGTGQCSVSVAANVSVTAKFDPEPQGGGLEEGGDGNDGGDVGGGYSYEEYYPTYASDFQGQFVQAKKPKKKRGVFKGYTPLPKQIRPEGKAFTGSVIGSNWKLAGSATEQVAQGVTVGKGSRTTIRVNMTTGTVNAQFEGKDGCWMVSYYSDQGAERKELYKCKGDAYQEELVPREGGEGERMALVMHKNTLYGGHDGGLFFMVPKGASIDMSPAEWIEGSVPSAPEPLIPVEKILQLVATSVQAAGRELTAVELYRLIGAYRGTQAEMFGTQQSFGMFDFNDPSIDYEAVQALVDKYQAAEAKLASIARQMGLASAFVRDGYWESQASQAADDLVTAGVHPKTAAFFAQMKQGFDFFAVQGGAGKAIVSAGSCAVLYDADGYPATTCSTRRVTAAEAARVATAGDAYEASKTSANRAMNGVEKALFSGNGR